MCVRAYIKATVVISAVKDGDDDERVEGPK